MSENQATPAFFCVVVESGAPRCLRYETRDDLVEALKALYASTRETGDPDTRIFVFSGTHLSLVGVDNRELVFPDGTAARLTNNPTPETDHLLAAVDRTRLRLA